MAILVELALEEKAELKPRAVQEVHAVDIPERLVRSGLEVAALP